MFPIRFLATASVAVLGGTSAFGQGCDSCGPAPLFGTGALFAPNKDLSRRPNANQPLCATKTYPLSDWAYIRKYCGPTLNPGSCYGHYQTKWRRWEEACPQGTGCATPVGAPILAPQNAMLTEPLHVPTPLPSKEPVPAPVPPKETGPKSEFIPEVSAPVTATPAPLPPMPPKPMAATVNPAEHEKPGGFAPPRPLQTLPNVVVPPLRDFPEKSRN